MSESSPGRRSWISRARGWLSIGLLTPVGVYVVFSPLHWELDTWAELLVDGLGWLLFALGAGWRWWATFYIGGHKDMQLAQNGPYSMSRNPLYFGTLMMALSAAIFMQSFLFAAVLIVVSVFYLGITVPNEEARLRIVFGETYENYCRRVPRFFPNPRLFQSPATLHVEAIGLRSEFLRTLRWMWIPFLCHALSHLRSQAWWVRWD